MKLDWQKKREEWIGHMTVAQVTAPPPEIWCACPGRFSDEPLCGCQMNDWYIDRTRRFVLKPIIDALKSRSAS